MYTGHVALALAARRLERTSPIWYFVVAAQGPDWVAIVAGLIGSRDPMELWSHSLPAVLVGAALVGIFALWRWKTTVAAGVAATLYVLHPMVDLITGIKPTWPGGPMLGLCGYDHPVLDLLFETAVVLAGWAFYRSTLPRQGGVAARRMLVGLLLCQGLIDAYNGARIVRWARRGEHRLVCDKFASAGALDSRAGTQSSFTISPNRSSESTRSDPRDTILIHSA